MLYQRVEKMELELQSMKDVIATQDQLVKIQEVCLPLYLECPISEPNLHHLIYFT